MYTFLGDDYSLYSYMMGLSKKVVALGLLEENTIA